MKCSNYFVRRPEACSLKWRMSCHYLVIHELNAKGTCYYRSWLDFLLLWQMVLL